MEARLILTLHQAQFSERKLPEIFPSFKTAKNLHDRYGVSKLLDILLVKQLADAISPSSSSSSSPPPVIVNGPHPGFCRTELFRTIPVLGQVVLGFFLRLLGRSSEEGARTLVAAALAGPESHGRYMCDAKVGNEAPWVRSEEAEQVGRKAWAELLVILEGILPGVTANL